MVKAILTKVYCNLDLRKESGLGIVDMNRKMAHLLCFVICVILRCKVTQMSV